MFLSRDNSGFPVFFSLRCDRRILRYHIAVCSRSTAAAYCGSVAATALLQFAAMSCGSTTATQRRRPAAGLPLSCRNTSLAILLQIIICSSIAREVLRQDSGRPAAGLRRCVAVVLPQDIAANCSKAVAATLPQYAAAVLREHTAI